MPRSPKKERPKSAPPAAPVQPEDGQSPEDESIVLLSRLETGTKVMVKRYHPVFARGFCTTLDVQEGGGDEIIPQIQANFGGGTYSLQTKRRDARGHYVFCGKGILLDIAGEPTYLGRKYLPGGRLEPEVNPQQQPVAPHPVVVQAAPQRSDGMGQQLLALFGEMVKGGGVGQNTDMARLFEVMLTAQQQQQPQRLPEPLDMFGGLERAFALFSKLSKQSEGRAGAPDESDDESMFGGMFGGGKQGAMIQNLILAKMFGADNAQPNQSSQPGAMPLGRPPTPAHVWHPISGWVHPSQLRPPAPPPAAPQPAAPQPAVPQPAVPSPAAETNDDEEQPPFTAEQMAEELEAMEDDERERFLPTLLERFGVPPEMLANATAAISKQASQAVPNVVDISGSYPIQTEPSTESSEG